MCMCLRALTGNEETDCLSRRYMKVSRFQVLNIHGVGQEATVLEPQAHPVGSFIKTSQFVTEGDCSSPRGSAQQMKIT